MAVKNQLESTAKQKNMSAMRGKEFSANRNNHQGCTVMRSFDYMTTLNIESRHWQLLIGIVAVILIGTLGVTAINAANNTFRPMSVDAQMLLQAADEEGGEPARKRCKECGVVASKRGIGSELASGATPRDAQALAGGSGNGAQISIRMADGSSRSITDTNPANWRTGERVIVIN